LVTLNFWGVNVPLKVPLPAEFVNVPFTTEVRLPTDAAGPDVAEVAVFSVVDVVAVTAAPAALAVSPVSATTEPAEMAIIRMDGTFIVPSL
jgi:hypothetical protein